MFSKACEYGIRAIVYVAFKSIDTKRVSLKQIAEEIDSPEAFTAKVLQQLVRSELIKSTKGPFGGFEIEEANSKSISLYEVVTSIDGDKMFVGCGLGLNKCNAKKPCPLHDKFEAIRSDLSRTLKERTLHKLATNYELGLTYLKR